MNEENHMGWKLVRGVRRDVIDLFKKFATTNSIRFEEFCKVWKEMNFSLIFSNRDSFIEMLEFTEELLQIIKGYLFSIYEFHVRVAALYALYGLYFKQPIRGAAKIRFTKVEWEELYNLIEHCKVAKHYDVAFIFAKLYLNGAYTFVATVRPAGLERGFRKYFDKRSNLFSKVCDVELLYRPLISEKLVDSLVKLESLYCRKKSQLLGSKNLIFIDGKFAQSLQEELKNYELASQSQYNLRHKVQASTNCESNSLSSVESTSNQKGATEAKITNSCKRKSTKLGGNNESDGKLNKRNKFGKKNLEVMAKKKAEYYIQKLNSGKNQESSEEKPVLMEIPILDYSKPSEDN